MSSDFSALWAAKDAAGWAAAVTEVNTSIWPAIQAAVTKGTDFLLEVSTNGASKFYVALILQDKGVFHVTHCETADGLRIGIKHI